MATKEQIFQVLAGGSAPVSRKEMEEKLEESYRSFQTQLDRWEKQGLIEDTGDHCYVLTEKGHEEALAEEIEEGQVETLVPEKPPKKVKEKAEEKKKDDDQSDETQLTTGTTEYAQFLRMGKYVGVIPMSLIKVTTDYVFSSGNYKDLAWVAKALQDMGIQRDLANRWLHAWGAHMQTPMPTDLPAFYQSTEEKKIGEKTEAERKEGAGRRDYMLSESNIPLYVGAGNGHLDYKDAMELAKIRNTAGKGDGVQSSPGSMADEVSKIFLAFKSMQGEQVAGKSYIVKPGVEGYEVEEVDPSKPVIIPQGPAAKATPTFYVDSEGKTQELAPGQPLVIVREAPKAPASGVQYLIDQKTGEMKEIAPGQPIIIRTESAAPLQATPIQMKDKEGNPMILDLSTYIKLEDHKDQSRRDEESHQVKLEIAKGFKELLKNAQTALAHMGEDQG